MPSAGGKCIFNRSWILLDDYKKWLAEVSSNKHEAYCKICRKKFNIGSMGKAALKSYMNGQTHQNRLKELNNAQQPTISGFLGAEAPAEKVPQENLNEGAQAHSSSSTSNTSLHHLSTLSKKVTDAELLWTLHCVHSHASAHSNGGMNELFKTRFCDSEIASTYSLSETKYRYLTTFGLGPHFGKLLANEAKRSPAHSIMFDESLNTQLQSKQLDVHIRYWSEDHSRVECRYYNSIFIGHSTANDLMEHYAEVTKDLDANKTWQIGMDGPNVNISFQRKIEEERADLGMASLLDVGTCGLHVVHGAFQTGCIKTDWKFDQYLKKEYKLFKDSPARREDYEEYTGTTVFPIKFCNHRWLENVDVASRSLAVLPHIEEYCRQATLRKTEPKNHEGYKLVRTSVTTDKLLKAKHLFWISLAQVFEPFLRLYQADRPLLPFLASDLDSLLRCLMGRFVKDSVLAQATSFVKLTKIDISSTENTKSSKQLDIGIATRRELDVLKDIISAKEELEFFMNCKAFMVRSTEKLLEKSPLKYPIVRAVRCLDPQIISGPAPRSVKMFEKLLHCLIDSKRVSAMESDNLKREYEKFVQDKVHGNPELLTKFKHYDKAKDQRIDELLAEQMSEDSNFKRLWALLKCVLVLSHGQAGVERGFSVNSQIMDHNLKEKSIVAQRTIHDHIKTCGGVLKVQIDNDLRSAAKNSSKMFKRELSEQKKRKDQEELDNANKAVNDDILQLKSKRNRLLNDAEAMKKSVDSFMIRAEKEQNLTYVTKANSYKRTIQEMEQEEKDIQVQIDALKKKLKVDRR